MSKPLTKGQAGVAQFRTIASDAKPRPVPEINFDWTPKSTVLVVSILGNNYPYPDQPEERWTTTNQELTFTADIRSPVGDFVTNYEWDFGDGTKGSGLEVTHTYTTASPSIRTVLSITDNHGRRFTQGRFMNLRAANVTLVSPAIYLPPA